jgi:hypothetical protein
LADCLVFECFSGFSVILEPQSMHREYCFAHSDRVPLSPVFRSTFLRTMAQKLLAADLMRVALGAMLPQPRGKAIAAPAAPAVVAAAAKDFRDCLISTVSDRI